MFFGRSVLVLFPFLDGRIADSKSQQIGKLGHGKLHVDPFLAQMLLESLWIGRVSPQVYEMGENC